jgi:predicted heme/steroid binding protein
MQEKVITREELLRCDGKGGAPAFVGYKRRIYDVTRSFHWKSGRHHAMHSACADLTSMLDQAPHGDDLLERFPVEGILAED